MVSLSSLRELKERNICSRLKIEVKIRRYLHCIRTEAELPANIMAVSMALKAGLVIISPRSFLL